MITIINYAGESDHGEVMFVVEAKGDGYGGMFFCCTTSLFWTP